MISLDLSYEGRQAAERRQLNNGVLPHGGYRGSKHHPLSLLSFDKGEGFPSKIQPDVQETLRHRQTIQEQQQESTPRGYSPSWSLRLLEEPSYSDQSLLFMHNYLAACRVEPDPEDLPRPRSGHLVGRRKLYYKPNSCHQFLSVTDLRNSAKGEIDVRLGRPTRTTLLRAKQHRESLSARVYQSRKEFLHRLHEIQRSNSVTESVRFDAMPNGESVHSFLTGARYNRYNVDRNSDSSRERGGSGHSPQAELPFPLHTNFKQRTTPADREVRPYLHWAARPTTMVKNRRVTSRTTLESKPTALMTIGIIGNTLSAKHLSSQPISSQGIRRNTPPDARCGVDISSKENNSSPGNIDEPQIHLPRRHSSSLSNQVKPILNLRKNSHVLTDATEASRVMPDEHIISSDANSPPNDQPSGSGLISKDPFYVKELETIVQEKNKMKVDDGATVVLRDISASQKFSEDHGSTSHDIPTAEFPREDDTEEKHSHVSDLDWTQESVRGEVDRTREVDRENIDLVDVPNSSNIEPFYRASRQILDETNIINADVFTNKNEGLSIVDSTDDDNALFE